MNLTPKSHGLLGHCHTQRARQREWVWCFSETKNAEDRERQRLPSAQKRLRGSHCVPEDSKCWLLSSFFSYGPGGQSLFLISWGWSVCLRLANTKNHLEVIIITFLSPPQLLATEGAGTPRDDKEQDRHREGMWDGSMRKLKLLPHLYQLK